MSPNHAIPPLLPFSSNALGKGRVETPKGLIEWD